MFEGFSRETSDFLWELSFHNERPWFLEHKEQFERCLNEPFKALAAETTERMRLRWPQLDFQSHVSRIYRDARRLYGRGPYKDHLWFTVESGATFRRGPAFWFELSAAEYNYGLGFWTIRPAGLEQFRRMIDANPARFERLAADVAAQKELHVAGQEYRTPKGNYGEPIRSWYSRKALVVECDRDFGGELLGPGLIDSLVSTYSRLMPLHDYFLEFYHSLGGDADLFF